MMTTRTKIAVTKLLLGIYISLPTIVAADCLGPPTSPILKIDIQHCELATQFDNTLRITGNARQVLTLFYAHATTSGDVEFVLEDKAISDRSFWATVAPREGCKEFLEKAEEVWLFADICNDVGENIPDVQITPLWPEAKSSAMQRLAEKENAAE